MKRLATLSALAFVAGGAAGCSSESDAPIDVVLVGDQEAALSLDARAGSAASALAAATREGIVEFDAEGRISPGLAESWIVTEDGLSFIFRLRPMRDSEGEPIAAREIRSLLLKAIEEQDETPLGLDLAGIESIHARTGRVIEIRLKSPMPEFLNLLAGSELALLTGRRDPRVMVLDIVDGEPRLLPTDRIEGSENRFSAAEALELRIMPPKQAVDFFQDGRAAVLLDGNIDGLPFVRMGGLLRGTIRLDPVSGLFGLAVAPTEEGFLSDPANREAIAMALDRRALIEPFNIGGWVPTTRLVPAGMPDTAAPPQERWSGLSLEERRAIGRRRVANWTAAEDAIAPLSISLPPGRGGDLLLEGLRDSLGSIGLNIVRADDPDGADLRLVDEVARIRMARWYLHRFDCTVSKAVCSPEADAMVAEAVREKNDARRAALLAEAEALLAAENAFIPIGSPIRFSLVRGSVEGFAVNTMGVHPLSQLALSQVAP